jgi:SPP1 gp7 family putative phage head morphogenesis protein
MIWERALEADARLAARNSVKIRAAIAQSFNAKRVYEQYLTTQPAVSNKPAQDRARARAWVIMNVRVNMEPLKEVMLRVWAEGYVTGDAFANEQVSMARVAAKADDGSYVDWSNWKPGDQASALLLRPPKAFQQLLQMQSITFKDFSDTTVRDIGNAIADAIELGMSAERSAKNIARHVANPARALSIAITEQNRAISYATINRFKESEIQKMEWQTSSPCDKCAQNQGQVIEIGGTFNSGSTQPPVHPHCRCVLLPVIPDFDELDATPTGTTLVTPPIAPVLPPVVAPTVIAPKPVSVNPGFAIYDEMDSRPFIPGKWEVVPREAMREVELSNIIRSRTTTIDRARAAVIYDIHAKKMDRDFVAKGVVYKNGPIEVQFGGVGLGVKEEIRKQVIEEVEKLQISNPKDRAVVHITKDSKNKYGWAYLGQEDLWVTPKIVKDTELKVASAGKFKMPVTPTTTQFQYTLAHEWGHIVDNLSPGSMSRQTTRTTEVITKLKKEFPDAFKSGYSGENSKEFYAEMFTEYYRTSGATTNPLVQAMATEFGWKVPEAPKVVVQYKPATKPFAYFTAEKSQDLYPLNAKGEPDYGAYNKGGQNLYLKNVMREQGFLGKPQVVSAQQFDNYVTQGGVPLYRGIAAKTPEDVDSYVSQLVYGEDPFVGKGMFGDGTYFTDSKSVGLKFAKEDAQGNPIPFGKVIDGVIDPRAKIIDIDDLRKDLNDWYESFPGGVSASDYAQDFYETLSPVAVARGYDVIRIKNPSVGLDPTAKVDAYYYVILNRTALIMKEIK